MKRGNAFPFQPVTNAQLLASLRELGTEVRDLFALIRITIHEVRAMREEMRQGFMATQADLDALVSQVNTATADITSEIEALKNANPSLDLSGLETAVQGLQNLDTSNAPAPAPVDPNA